MASSSSSSSSGSHGDGRRFLRVTATSGALFLVCFSLIVFVFQGTKINIFRLRQTDQRLALLPGFNATRRRLGKNIALLNVTNGRAVAAAQRERIQLLRDRCSELKRNRTASASDPLRSSFNKIVNAKLSYFYCVIPKVACTSILTVLAAASGAPRDLNVHHAANRHRYLKLLKRPDDAAHYNFRFMFVRHPFERLVSAYRDKFINIKTEKSVEYFKTIAKKIKRRYRSNDKDGMVTFKEFVHFLLDHRRRKQSLDRHWRPYTELCQPCKIQYDFIGHIETIGDDSLYVLRKIGIDNRVTFPRKHSHEKTSSYKQYFAQLTPAEVDGLRRIYRHDFQLFGYE